MNEKGLITFSELKESWEEGNESLLSFVGGAAIVMLTSFPDKLAHSKWGRWLGLGGLAVFAAACGPSMAVAPVTPEITPIPPTPTLVAPGEDIRFHLDVNTESRNFGLSSTVMDVEVLDSLYPGAMARLKELGFDLNAMDFIQYMINDGRGENENYLIAQNPLTGEMVMPWEISTDGWGTIDPSDGSGKRHEWSKVAVEQGADGAFNLTTFNGRYFLLGREAGPNGKWLAGLPALDKNTGKNVRLGEVKGGGGMLFAPAEAFKLVADGEGEEYAGALYTPTAVDSKPVETSVVTQLPADVLAVLQDQKYTMVDTNGDGNKDIVAENGDTLFQFVSEADRINGKEWQRMITFTLENGDKMEMDRFETPEEAYEYILKDGTIWGDSYIFNNNRTTAEDRLLLNQLFAISGLGDEFMGGIPISNSDSTSQSRVMLYSMNVGTVIVYRGDDGNARAMYVDKSVSAVRAGLS